MAFWKATSVLEQDSFLGNVAGQVHSAMPPQPRYSLSSSGY